MTTQEKLDFVNLIKQIQHSYHLEQYTEAALQPLVKALDQAQSEVMASITNKAAELTEWQEERALALLDEYSNLQLGIRNALGESIAEIGAQAGASSYLVHNDILSFGGAVNGFNNVALTATQIQSMLVSTPVGGQLLSGWIDSAFEAQKEGIRQEVLTGLLKGEGYPAMVRRFQEGWGMTKDDATTICRSYVQAANVNAAHDVARANKDIMKGWKWQSASENGAYYTSSGKGRGRGVCMICLALSASDEIYPLDGGPEIPAHPRCRCHREYITKSWRELGVPIDEIESAYRPYSVRGKGIDAETGEIIPQSVGTGGRNILSAGVLKGDYEDFFKTVLTPMEQKMTIGPMRLELYNSGKIKSLGDLVEVVDGKARLRLLERVDGKAVGLKGLGSAGEGGGGLGGLGGVKVAEVGKAGWIPAKNLDELNKGFEKIVGIKQVSFGEYSEVEMLKIGNDTLEHFNDLFTKYPVLKETSSEEPLRKLWMGKKIWLDEEGVMGRFYKNDLAIDIGAEQIKDHTLTIGKYDIGKDYFSTLRHEYGHFYNTSLTTEQRDDWSWLYRTKTQLEHSYSVSIYGAGSEGELFAESFCAYTSPLYKPGLLPKEIEEYFDKLLRRK